MSKVKAKRGQPTTYKPEYCGQVIEWGKQGKSILWMSCQLEVTRTTFQNWGEAHPEFLVALQRAKAEWQLFEEEEARKYKVIEPNGPRLDTGLYKFHMASWFREDYAQDKEGTNSNAPQKLDITVTSK